MFMVGENHHYHGKYWQKNKIKNTSTVLILSYTQKRYFPFSERIHQQILSNKVCIICILWNMIKKHLLNALYANVKEFNVLSCFYT